MNWKDMFPKENRYFETENGILYCGDSIEIMKKFSKESIDFIFSDYPFNCQDNRKDYVKFISDLSVEYFRLLKINSVLLIINNPINIWKSKHAYDSFTHRDSIALIRKGALRPAWRFGFQHNYLMTFVKGNDVRAKWNGTKKNHDKTFLTDVINYQNGYRGKGKDFHPQAVPLGLTKQMISIFSDETDIVLDPFMGSGTAAIACERINRKWIGIELKEKYCEMIVRRLEKYFDNKAGNLL